MPGDYIPPDRKLYLTPDAPVTGRFCRSIIIPDDPAWVGAVDGALSQLAEAESWREFGDLSPEETAQDFLEILDDAWSRPSCDLVPTPYWDTASDVDDEMPSDAQTWYGYVEDVDDDPSLTFTEDATIWLFTGLVAYAGGIGAAIAFRTVAPSFVLKARGKTTPEIIRIWIDGVLAGEYDTTGMEDQIIDMPVVADADLATHDVYVVKAG